MVNGIYVFVCVFCAFSTRGAISELTFTSTPSSKVVSGQFLKLSCSVDDKQVPIVWMKDGEDIGNDCVLYGKYVDRTCSKVQNAFNLIFRAELSDQGIWSCSYGARMKKSIRIEVVVPALVYPLKVIPYGNPSSQADNQAQTISLAASSNLQLNSGLRVFGTGTRQNPIDLTGRHPSSATEVLIQCRSTCASVQHHLQWKCANSTWSGILRPSVVDIILEHTMTHEGTVGFSSQGSCPKDSQSVLGQVRIGCASSTSAPTTGGDARMMNALQGLNRILCQPDHTNEQAFIDESTPNIPQYAFLMSSAGLPVNVTVSELQSNECSQTAYQRGACVYVMCPGHPVPLFTVGERVALAAAIPLFLLFCLVLCYLTRQRRRAKRKANMAPGQCQEIELML
ncbi:hypothetical protein P879_05974 [Paragonimus westermani]|uniref:Ig-like domain-containing protein n=1 Tax=Paragonimus westermani TaxID=34504 RepID=A0A8T0DDJ9_9TREM|nr:hypothetical protein P879_05974 [Paragonimus westermani]